MGNINPQKTRIFYGFKKNGRHLLNGSYFYSFEMNVTNEIKEINETNKTILYRNKYEGESLVIRENRNITDKKEYLMSLSKKFSFVEIYDFEKEITYKKDLNIFANCTFPIFSYRHAFIPLLSNDTNYYYLFGFINNQSRFIIQKHLFNSVQDFESEDTLIKNITINNFKAKVPTSGLSCFQTEQEFIICFFLTLNSNFVLAAYNTNLDEIKNISLSLKIENSNNNPFYKCLHLKGEIGIFTFYNNSFPVLLVLEYNNNSGFNNIIPEINLNITENNETHLDDDLLLNDMIKISENKIYYCSTEKSKETIYIISIYLYNNTYKIRYYLINIKEYGK
jgi:hypothetical protein